MTDRKTVLADMIAKLRQQRDELAVQMHLGQAEAKEKWDELQQQFERLMSEYEPLRDAAEDATENVIAGLELTAGEVQKGFQSMAKAMLDQFKEKGDA